MRRLPRLSRPSGLTAAAAAACSNAVSQTAPVRISTCLAAASSFSTSSAPASRRPLATATTTQLRPSSMRFYSSEKQQTESLAQTTEHETASQLSSDALGSITALSGQEADDVPGKHGPYTVPTSRVDAARETEIADPTYVPATSAIGLRQVGDISKWWEKNENWASAGNFVGFKARKKITDPLLIEIAVRRAVLEAFALRALGREDELVANWPVRLPPGRLLQLLATDATGNPDGELVFAEGHAEAIVDGMKWDHEWGERSSGKPLAGLKSTEFAPLRETWNSSWKIVYLTDPRIRFAITKRVFHLTGQLIPDHQLDDIKTVQSLIHMLQKPPKPATLTEVLQKHEQLQDLSNVTIADKRVTRGDKEVALGRYKLTQAEFAKRGLPAKGFGRARKGKEIARLRGAV